MLIGIPVIQENELMMTKADEEKIKLHANYLNGCAIAFFGTGCLGIVFALLSKGTAISPYSSAIYLIFFIGSLMWHYAAQRTLNRLRS